MVEFWTSLHGFYVAIQMKEAMYGSGGPIHSANTASASATQSTAIAIVGRAKKTRFTRRRPDHPGAKEASAAASEPSQCQDELGEIELTPTTYKIVLQWKRNTS